MLVGKERAQPVESNNLAPSAWEFVSIAVGVDSLQGVKLFFFNITLLPKTDDWSKFVN
jgi:hypothetical protein